MTDPDLDHDLAERLRRLGHALDGASPPVSAEEARGRAVGLRRPRWVLPTLAVAACVVLTGLAGIAMTQRATNTSVTAGGSDRVASETTTTSNAPSTSAPSTTTTTATTTTSPSTTASPATTDSLPGERVDIHPQRGARLAVVGVADGDTLNVRTGPGTQYPVAFTLEPLADDVRATGHNRSVGNGFWSEIEAAGRSGWASSRFLLQPGVVDDVTARWYPSPSDRPSATTMEGLADAVARKAEQEMTGDDGNGRPALRVIVVDIASGGDPAEVTVDVIGLEDDAVGGLRLHAFAERAGERFVLRTIEAKTLCRRGVTSEGHCI